MRFKNVKNYFSAALISGIILPLFTITACGGGGGGDDTPSYTKVTKSDTYVGVDKVFKVETSGDTEITYSIDLGYNTGTVYYIFTNTNLSADTTSPSYLADFIDQNDEDFPIDKPLFSESTPSGTLSKSLQRGKPEITEFNSNPWKHTGLGNGFERRRSYTIDNNAKGPLRAYTANTSTNTFMNTSTSDTIQATCRAVVTDGTKTLNIWVADNCWITGGTKTNKVDTTMVNTMAAKFLASGTGNDVYDWVTNIYGAEWGTHTYTDLISPATTDNNIHILLYDIDNDNSTTGGVLGFFWSKDNFKSSEVSYSNEKIMFYMDAVMFATTPGTWAITDPMPAEIISTLAHEFQHMIHFYQKNVSHAVADTDTWVNEMCSLVTEDLVADKLQVNGPRGVAYGTPGTGSTNNTDGRLPLFNYWDDAPLTAWLSGNDAIISYSVSYAFGAYLARNYSGALLFRDIVQGVSGKSVYGDYRDVVEAVNANNGSDPDVTMGDLMRNWGAAVVLSGSIGAGRYKYNNGNSYMTSTINSIIYNLGSISMFNYKYQYDTSSWLYEPWCYSATGLNSYYLGTMNRGSNIYVKEPTGSGIKKRTFRMKDGVKLTVVVK